MKNIEELKKKVIIIKTQSEDIYSKRKKEVYLWEIKFKELINITKNLNNKFYIWVGLRCFQLTKRNLYYGWFDIEPVFDYKSYLVLKFAPKLYKKFLRKISKYVTKHYKKEIYLKPRTYCNHCGCSLHDE